MAILAIEIPHKDLIICYHHRFSGKNISFSSLHKIRMKAYKRLYFPNTSFRLIKKKLTCTGKIYPTLTLYHQEK